VAVGGEFVELGARKKPPFRGDQFGADPLWHEAFRVSGPPMSWAEWVAARQTPSCPSGTRLIDSTPARRWTTSYAPASHALGGKADGLLAAAALAVDGHARDGIRESGAPANALRAMLTAWVADLGDGRRRSRSSICAGSTAGAGHQFAQAVRQQVGGQQRHAVPPLGLALLPTGVRTAPTMTASRP